MEDLVRFDDARETVGQGAVLCLVDALRELLYG